jgi:PTS system nitrogen regulatory IIA component
VRPLAKPPMIRLEQILTPGRSLVNVPGGSKKRVLEQIAKLIGENLPDVAQQTVYEALIAREKLGSTGFGNGIAIPHCRLDNCQSPMSALLHLETPVDFDAIDGAPVDLIFVLLVPKAATDAHLELLRQIASMLDRKEVRERLRSAQDSSALYQVVLNAQAGA